MTAGVGGLLGPVKNLLHLSERINLFWGIFLLDRRLAFVSGLPPTIQEDHRQVHTRSPQFQREVVYLPSSFTGHHYSMATLVR